MKDIRQSAPYAGYLSRTGWIVKKSSGINYFIKRLPFIGSLIKLQRPEKIEIDNINELTKEYRAFQVIVEPKNLADANKLEANGFKLNKSPYLPTKTLQINLTKSKEEIYKKLKKDTRYAIRKNAGIKINSSLDVEEFRNIWKSAVGVKRYIPPLKHLIALNKSFGKKCIFSLCSDASKHIKAGAIFLTAEGIGYYWQAFTNKEGRRALAQYKIVWEGLLWAKRKGARIFDFEGIYDERFPNKSWLGFTHFKKSFGGNVIEYPGTFVKNRIPL